MVRPSAPLPSRGCWLSAVFDRAESWATRLVQSGQARNAPHDEGRGFWVLAEVLRRKGDLKGADTAIEKALPLLRTASVHDVPGALGTLAALNAAKIKDPALRKTFLENVYENQQTLKLAAELLESVPCVGRGLRRAWSFFSPSENHVHCRGTRRLARRWLVLACPSTGT